MFALSTIFHFNPRSYKRSDLYIIINIICCVISIHAPTRGATLSFLLLFWNPLYFNPRSYKRSDSLSQSFSATLPISIHAPTRGATISLDVAFSHISISIHAPTRGATNLHINCECRIKFQSTLLQEERHFYVECWCICSQFQSTLLQEERRLKPLNQALLAQFQSTLLQEERQERTMDQLEEILISIHAPTRGATFQFPS